MNSWYHAQTAAKKFGGNPEDYIEIESFIDGSKRIIGDVRHRSMYHHTEGIFLCERIFGTTITVDKADRPREVPVRLIAELHVMQDLGWIPSPKDYIDSMELKQWMGGSVKRTEPIQDLFGPVPDSRQDTSVYYDRPVKPRESEYSCPNCGKDFFHPAVLELHMTQECDPPPVPLVPDPNMMIDVISPGTKIPKRKRTSDYID